jgi:3',5'-cyclic AMP phosphodiesterase CpdA
MPTPQPKPNYLEIIHVSDMHFGKNHRFAQLETPDGRTRAGTAPSLADKLIEDLRTAEAQPKRPSVGLSERADKRFEVPDMPRIVCLSGDFTQTASAQEFKQARHLAEQLGELNQLGLNKDSLFFCPGNHDVVWDKDDEELRWGPYATFLSGVSGEYHDPKKGEFFGGVQINEAAKVVVMSLNTELKVKDEKGEKCRGDLSIGQRDWIEAELAKLNAQQRGYIKVAMMHHHPVLLPIFAEPGRGYDAVVGAEWLMPLLHEHGFHLVLHGHKHYPHTFREDIRNAFLKTKEHSLFVVAGGSCGSKELPEPDIATQCYNRIRIHSCEELGTTRVQVLTRGLVARPEGGGLELNPTKWKWKTLAFDDRSYTSHVDKTDLSAGSMKYMRSVAAASKANQARESESRRTRRNYPVGEMRPAMFPGQTIEVHLRVVRHEGNHPRKRGDDPVAVTWSGGPIWFPSVRVTRQEDPEFRAVFTYWGGSLLQAELEFEDGTTEVTHVYVPMPPGQKPADKEPKARRKSAAPKRNRKASK